MYQPIDARARKSVAGTYQRGPVPLVFGRSERGGNNTANIAARLERTHVQSSEAISFAVCEKHINAPRMPYIPDSHVGNDDTGADFDLAGEEGRNARGLTRT